jgi:hypothetical protein
MSGKRQMQTLGAPGDSSLSLTSYMTVLDSMFKHRVAATVQQVTRYSEQVAHKKPNLPEKECATCKRPFAWRKKWARHWDEVKYCSDRCRANRPAAA